jgi:hypothetical protein
MTAEVKEPKQQDGVNVDHPSLVAAAKNLASQGKTREEIAKITGLPIEVAEKYERQAREKK